MPFYRHAYRVFTKAASGVGLQISSHQVVTYTAMRYLASRTRMQQEVIVTPLGEKSLDEDVVKRIKSRAMPQQRSPQEKVMMVNIQDMLRSEDRYCSLLVFSGGESVVKYGKAGIAPSENVGVKDLLVFEKPIPKGVTMLDIGHSVPFTISSERAKELFVINTSIDPLKEAPSHEENLKRYSLHTACDLPYDLSKRLSIEIQRKIFSDRDNEEFYQEMTSVVTPPTELLKSSATWMNFEQRQMDVLNSTDTHFHPGSRLLIIFTTSKKAGATLNFCGISESPEDRPDCEVKLKFEPNKIQVLHFGEEVHHRFEGDFVCLSIHPKDSDSIIKALKEGKLPEGFLERATIFSQSSKNQIQGIPNPEVFKPAPADKLTTKQRESHHD